MTNKDIIDILHICEDAVVEHGYSFDEFNEFTDYIERLYTIANSDEFISKKEVLGLAKTLTYDIGLPGVEPVKQKIIHCSSIEHLKTLSERVANNDTEPSIKKVNAKEFNLGDHYNV